METGQVFVSHTSDMALFPERRSFVQAVLDAVSRAGMASVDVRYFPARSVTPAEYCRQRVRDCQVYVAVIGFRYGSTVPDEVISYTELEFREATVAGLPTLVFLLREGASPPEVRVDADRREVDEFRQRLQTAGVLVREFSSDAELELEVFHALRDLPSSEERTDFRAMGIRHSLPPDTAAFTDRGAELRRITSAMAQPGGEMAIRAINGMPGVGKTALAVHAAHALSGRFADRQLFIDLHAHTPGRRPVPPETALAGLLAATGLDPRNLPDTLEGRADLWRDRMTGQNALLVLDNAASSAQVIPLLPGGGCLVLITSRRHLGDLPGTVLAIPLGGLPLNQAERMFIRLAPRAAKSPDGSVTKVAEMAGYLPLAISLLARVYARHPSWTLNDLAAETGATALTLAAEHQTVAAAFQTSYRHLGPARQHFFRTLGIHPGTSIDVYAAAALAGTDLRGAVRHLDGLHREGLLTETGYRRYGMHDLIRRYARDHAAAHPADSQRALDQVLDYYQQTAARAEARLTRFTRPGPAPAISVPEDATPGLEDAGQALEWARANRTSLLACLDHATDVGQHSRVIALTAGLTELLRHDGPWPDALIRHTTAVQAARHLGDPLSEANALADLADIRRLMGRYPQAIQIFEQALGIYHEVGSQLGRANILTSLGGARWFTGDFPGAVRYLEQALGICRNLTDQPGQAAALNNLGLTRWQTGEYQAATQDLELALSIYRHLRNGICEANTLINLAAVRCQTGDYPAAARDLEQSLSISRDLGDRFGQANALTDLGDLRRQTGDYPAAARDLEQALSIYRDLGNRSGQADVLNNLGAMRRRMGEYLAAARDLEAAIGIYSDLGNRPGQAKVLNEKGTLHLVGGNIASAGQCHQQALDLARAIASPWSEAYALIGLSLCAKAASHTTKAQVLLQQAQAIFQRIGADDAHVLLAELDALTGQQPTG